MMLSLSRLSLSASVSPGVINLVRNGTFDTDVSEWTQIFGAVTWQAGRLRATANGTNDGRAGQTITCVIGGVYTISVDVTALSIATGGSVFISTTIGVGAAIASDQTSGVKTKTFSFTATATTHYVLLSTGVGTADAYAEFDNISVRPASFEANLGADGYTLVQAGTGTAVESSPGVYDLTGDGTNNQIARRSYTVESGARYLLEFDVSQNAGQVLVGTTSGGSTLLTTTTINVGAGKYIVTATGTTTMWVQFQKSGANLCRISGISLRKII